jgi:hypothetical protein
MTFRVTTGANPTTAIYNASAAKIYNATSSLVRFENKNIFVYNEKCHSLLQALYVVVNLKVVPRIGSREMFIRIK